MPFNDVATTRLTLGIHKSVLVACATFLACASALPATSVSVAYTPEITADIEAYLVEWQAAAQRAHVAERFVAGDGSYVDDGTQRVITFDGAGMPPFLIDTTDCNGNPMQQSVEITQAVFRPVSGKLRKGKSQVVEIGYYTDIGGCTPGQQTPFGSLDDLGVSTDNLDMTLRAAMTDIVPGARLAGPTEQPEWQGLTYFLDGDVTTIGNQTIQFQSTGDQFPTTMVDGWLVIELGGFSRAYTRVTRDLKTGVEAWLVADWVDGAPTDVESLALIVSTSNAGFGDLSRTAHIWNEGLFANGPQQVAYYLYRNMKGIRVLNGDVEDGQPVTWALPGGTVQISRRLGNGYYYLRTWVPLANYGKNHFVMEREDLYDKSGYVGPNVPARVDWYVDEGKAAKSSLGRGQPHTARTAQAEFIAFGPDLEQGVVAPLAVDVEAVAHQLQ